MTAPARTSLGLRLKERIARTGPIRIDDYMAACLGDPDDGYYMTREPFGVAGDFITAPEVSQIFGELIGIWAVGAWQAMGCPDPFLLAELGPGRGTLMADALRAAGRVPEFRRAAQIVLVETSPRLREIQQQRLSGEAIEWAESIDALPPGPAIFLANEFFDALPVRQFVRTATGWSERMVGLDGGELAFRLGPEEQRGGMPADLVPGTIVEIAEVARSIVAALARRIAGSGGALLAIDYGHDGAGVGDTLQAVRAHAYDPPLAHPGEADLTVHVDFAALAATARAHGAMPAPILTQGDFLLAMGLLERAGRLGAGKPAAIQDGLRSAAERLAGPDQMGTLFKVLCVSAPGLTLFPFPPAPGTAT